MNDSAVRVGVGTRLKYDGEVVTAEEMFGSAAGNEVLVRDRTERRFRWSLREVLVSGRATVIAEGPGPASDDPRETASIVLAQLTDEELDAIRERAAHINEVLYGFRSGSAEFPAKGAADCPTLAAYCRAVGTSPSTVDGTTAAPGTRPAGAALDPRSVRAPDAPHRIRSADPARPLARSPARPLAHLLDDLAA
ncbi:hypothetical protein ACWDYJ_24685 [Streptomyces sp. NPDC003042]